MMFGDFAKALAQIGDPAFRRVLVRALLITLAILGPFVFGTAAVIQWVVPDQVSLPFIGPIDWLNEALAGAGLAVLLFLSSFLMIPVAGAIVGLFQDEIADAVEERHYPGLPPTPRAPLWDTLVDGLRFMGLFAVVNLLALVVYLLSSLLAPVVFWLVNGFLLGREYFQLVAMRRLGRRQADRLRRRHLLQIWLAGVLMAVPLTVPVLNLIVPILGVATYTHMFHRLWRGDAAAAARAEAQRIAGR